MSNLSNPQEFLNKSKFHNSDGTKNEQKISLLEAMKEYGRHVRDKTLEWAVMNAKHYNSSDEFDMNEYGFIKYDSVMNGKTHKDLEI